MLMMMDISTDLFHSINVVLTVLSNCSISPAPDTVLRLSRYLFLLLHFV